MFSNLKKDITELLAENIISSETAERIANYYQTKKASEPNKIFVAFGVLGATLLGLGIILILAHNWDNFPKTIKTVWAFIPLIIGQGFVVYSIIKNKSAVWKESSGVFLFFAIGASMALISQIYNIPGSFANYMLAWVALGLPLVYLLNSKAVALLTLVYATNYAINLGYSLNDAKTIPYWYLAYLLFLSPFYLNLLKKHPNSNWTSAFNWLVPLSLLLAFFGFIENKWMLAYVFLFGLFYNIGKLPQFANKSLRTNGYLVVGSVGSLICLFIASFKDYWQSGLTEKYMSFNDVFVLSFLAIAAIIALIFSKTLQTFSKLSVFQVLFALFLLIYLIGINNVLAATIFTNIVILLMGINVIKIGASSNHLGVFNYGLFIITVLIICRFFDFESFIVRGLMFVVVGAGFFGANYFMIKKRKITQQ